MKGWIKASMFNLMFGGAPTCGCGAPATGFQPIATSDPVTGRQIPAKLAGIVLVCDEHEAWRQDIRFVKRNPSELGSERQGF